MYDLFICKKTIKQFDTTIYSYLNKYRCIHN